MTPLLNLLDQATDALNSATPGSEVERLCEAHRRAILDCIRAIGMDVGRILIDQDCRQFEMGNEDRPMCGGVWLDKVSP